MNGLRTLIPVCLFINCLEAVLHLASDRGTIFTQVYAVLNADFR